MGRRDAVVGALLGRSCATVLNGGLGRECQLCSLSITRQNSVRAGCCCVVSSLRSARRSGSGDGWPMGSGMSFSGRSLGGAGSRDAGIALVSSGIHAAALHGSRRAPPTNS